MATTGTDQKTQDTGTITQKKPGGEESGSTPAAQPTGKKGEDGTQEANTGGKDAVELIKQDRQNGSGWPRPT